jgi:hypothetical protein
MQLRRDPPRSRFRQVRVDYRTNNSITSEPTHFQILSEFTFSKKKSNPLRNRHQKVELSLESAAKASTAATTENPFKTRSTPPPRHLPNRQTEIVIFHIRGRRI